MPTSSIWVGSRSVSIKCPKPSPSPPPLIFYIEHIRFCFSSPWWLLWWLNVCFFRWSLREKLFPQSPHLCFLSPVWIRKCRCNSSDLKMRQVLKHPNPQIWLFFSPGEPPDASWPTAKVGLISYVPSKVSSQVWRLLVDLSAVWIVAQVHCWLPSRPIHVDLKMIWWSFLFNWCKELKSPARVHAQGTSTSFTFSVKGGQVKTVLAQFELPCIHPSLSLFTCWHRRVQEPVGRCRRSSPSVELQPGHRDQQWTRLWWQNISLNGSLRLTLLL